MPIPSRIARLLLAGALAALAAACTMEDHSGSCSLAVLGPCLGAVTIPDSSYNLVGWPASKVSNSVGTIDVGDSLRLYFVRRGYLNPCDEGTDTIRAGGTWVVTKPFGGLADSSVAAVTPLTDGGALLRAKSAGQFGIWYERDAPAAPPLGVWQDITICPGNNLVFEFQVN